MASPAWLVSVLGFVASCAQPANLTEDAVDVADVVAADAADVVAGDSVPYPVPDWATVPAADVALDAAALEKARAYSESVGGLCLLVVRHGQIAFEAYYNGASVTSQQKSWSMAKSFTSAAIGIALKRGEIKDLQASASDYIPSWKGTDHEPIQLIHLLNMVSGLHVNSLDDALFTMAPDMTAASLGLPVEVTPNSKYNYSNHETQIFQPILQAATGMSPEDYLRKYLWQPLGFQATTLWGKDNAGHTTMFMGVEASCRDYARFGYFWLHKGNWNGQQIIDPSYIEATLAPSSPVNHGHSHYWWLNGFTPYINSQNSQDSTSVMMFPDAPPDLFSAQGLGQNFIDVVPSTDTIYIHTRPMAMDNLEGLLNDGKMVQHREILRLLLLADVKKP